MQIVIDIPEEKYELIKEQVASGIMNPLKEYIANGTVLPKHGRLIDADALEVGAEYVLDDGFIIHVSAIPLGRITNAPTILEAWGDEE